MAKPTSEFAERLLLTAMEREELLSVAGSGLGDALDLFAVIWLRSSADPERLDPVHVHHPNPDLQRHAAALFGEEPVREGEGVVGRAASGGQVVHEMGVDEGLMRMLTPAAAHHSIGLLKTTEILAVPLGEEADLGVILLGNSPDRAPLDGDDLALLEDLVRMAEVSLRLAGRMREHDEERRSWESQQLKHAVLQAKMLQAQKLESLGVLAGGIAHDFNNLLTGFMGQTGIALEKLDLESPARRHIESAISAAQRAADLVSQMLAYSGGGGFETRPMDLTALVKDMVGLLEFALPSGVSVEVSLADHPTIITGEAGQIRQVVMNLITNAADSMSQSGGTVRVVTGQFFSSMEPLDPQTSLGDLLPGGAAFFEVSDTGCGMSKGVVERMFDPFFSTKQTGRGLGLSAVQGIVRGHRGAIRVESVTDQGTTIRVLFPTTDELPRAERPRDKKKPTRGMSVLIIDDEKEARDAMAEVLKFRGFRVLAATGGLDGVEQFRAHEAELDLVVLDLTMPDLSGEETFARLCQLNPNVPTLLTSGYQELAASTQFEGGRLVGFLAKPWTIEQFVSTVETALHPSDS